MLKHRNQLAAALALAASAVLASAGAAAAGTAPQGRHTPPLTVHASRPAPAGVTQRAAGAVPLRVPNPAAYAAQKAAANAAAARLAGRHSAAAGARVLAPTAFRNWAGQRDTTTAPSDSNTVVTRKVTSSPPEAVT